jgi:low temperature requirement protein LtrA
MKRLHQAYVEAPAGGVTPAELFFDLVFVFTLTQLSRTLETDLSWASAGRVLLIFGMLWWMYSGYAWLTNHMRPTESGRKILLFLAMCAFLLTAVAVPDAFGGTGLLFGLGYLAVTVLHLLLFLRTDAVAGVRRLAPYNLGAALLLVVAGLLSGPVVYVVWIAAFLLQTVLPYLAPQHSWVGVASAFHLTAEHFVERHGLLVIIALGESVIAIGMGVDIAHMTAGVVGAMVLATLLPGALWWAYFSEVGAAAQALDAAQDAHRSRLAARVYIFSHILVLLGIVAAAAGLHAAVAHPAQPAHLGSATALAAGVALFLVGLADLRRALAIGSMTAWLLAAAAGLATIPLGAAVNSVAQLALIIGIVVAMIVLAGRRHYLARTEPSAA